MPATAQTVGGVLRTLRQRYDRLTTERKQATTRAERRRLTDEIDRVLDDLRTVRILRHGYSNTL